MTKLPTDAVPNITNNQVQINTVAPSLSPFDIEKQVTYLVETTPRRDQGAGVHPLPLAQWLFAGHCRLR
jgi:hypothetical protein